MDIEVTKLEFENYKYIPQKLEQLKTKLQTIVDKSESTTSSMCTTGRVTGGSISDKVGNNVVLKIDYEKQIEVLEDQCFRVEKYISNLSSTDCELSIILHYRYIEDMTQDKIAIQMKCTKKTICTKLLVFFAANGNDETKETNS